MGFAGDQLTPLVDEGLGNGPYLIDLGDVLAVDATRVPRPVRRTAGRPADNPAGTVVHRERGERAMTAAGRTLETGE
jgi:hypothetical protein